MSIITLTTDWSSNSIYLSSLKGNIVSKCRQVTIIDLCNSIEPFNLMQTGFILKSAIKNFPDNTIHIICVNSEADEHHNNIITRANNQIFISNDNGIFGLIFDEEVDKIIRINKEKYPQTDTFPELSIFSNIACEIINGKPIEEFGEEAEEFNRQFPMQATFDDSVILGKIIYIDSYKNAITNISKDLFDRVRKDRKFSIFVKTNRNKISKINTTYNETEAGDILAIFNSLGLLEIAQYKGFISELLDLDYDTNVRINFYDE